MRIRLSTILMGAILLLVPTAGWADLAPYSQDFENLDQTDPGALAGDGWLVFGNVFNPDWSYAYGYGPFPAPNGGPGFCAIDIGQGGPEQGDQQLVVYSDYNNGDHANGKWIEANVFQEQTIGASDVGTTWLFEYEAKRGNIEGNTTARAFFKTLDPANNFALTNFIWVDMTNVPVDWSDYEIAIFIDPTLEGQILQFGFLSTATGYQGSGIFYDNVVFRQQPLAVGLDVKPGSCPNPLVRRTRGLLAAAVLGSWDFDVNNIDVSSLRLEGVAPIRSDYEDVGEPYGGQLCGCTEGGPDGYVDLTMKFKTKDILDALGQAPTGDQVLTLTGRLLDGTPIEGQDCVILVGRLDPPGLPVEGEAPSALDSSKTSTSFNSR